MPSLSKRRIERARASRAQVRRFRAGQAGHDDCAEYDTAVADLVAYMSWMAEPAQNKRRRLGVWVLLFLGYSAVLVWRLNASYWKDVK